MECWYSRQVNITACGQASNAVKFTDIDGLMYVQAAQAILPEESDESEWERLETKRRHASMRARLERLKTSHWQLQHAIKSGKDISEFNFSVEWLESAISVLESKCAALPADDNETSKPMDDESESIDDEPTHDESEPVSVSAPESTVASGCGECDSDLAG
jgi:hypothetical protein